jgi:DNA-binding NarL/FixJ family response regulator
MLNFLLGLFGNLLAAELSAWCPDVARKIVCAAAKSMPHSMQQRMLEEWSALLNDTPGDLSKLWVAISLYWKRSRIADQCEDTAESTIPSLLMDTLTDTEDAVLELTAQGRTVDEISNLLSLNRTTVEYHKINCAQKLSGQSSIGRKDLVSFFAAGHKYSRSSKLRRLIRNFRRERSWRNLRMREREMREGEWKRNGGW